MTEDCCVLVDFTKFVLLPIDGFLLSNILIFLLQLCLKCSYLVLLSSDVSLTGVVHEHFPVDHSELLGLVIDLTSKACPLE